MAVPSYSWQQRSQLHKMYHSRCTAKNSWWCAERLPETCRVVIPIKLEFSASAGFIHKESVTMHGHTTRKIFTLWLEEILKIWMHDASMKLRSWMVGHWWVIHKITHSIAFSSQWNDMKNMTYNTQECICKLKLYLTLNPPINFYVIFLVLMHPTRRSIER